MSNPIRLQFKADTFENWQILEGYDLLFPDAPEAAIPLLGECIIVVGNEDLKIYSGFSENVNWFKSYNLFEGKKLNNVKILNYLPKNTTEYFLENGTSFYWDSSLNKFVSELLTINLNIRKKGILNYDVSEDKWEIVENVIKVPEDEIDSGIYNTTLQAPSFAGQSLSFESSNT